MAAVMGRTHPELFAAVCVHSGIAYAIAHDLPSALAAMRGPVGRPAARASASPIPGVPTIVFHGDRDTVVHPSDADHVIAQPTACREGESAPYGTSEPRVTVNKGRVPGGQCLQAHSLPR